MLNGILGILLCGFLWAWGGSHGTAWRKVGVPVSIAIMGISFLPHSPWQYFWHITSCILLGIAITIPYGMPSKDWSDKGGKLGRFFYRLTGDLVYAKCYTRAVCGLAYFGSLSFFPYINGHLIMGGMVIWLGVACYLTLTLAMENKPPIRIGDMVLNFEETMIGLSVGIGGLLCLL